MNHIVLKSALTAAVFGTGTASLAAPAVYPFEQPPRFGAPAAEGAAMVQAAPSRACNPSGSYTRNDQDRVVSVDLELVRTRSTINNPDPTTGGPDDVLELRSYGGCKTGPVIEVWPGDTLRIGLDNKLSTNDPSCQEDPPAGLGVPPGVGCYNTTNLHTHGLHVSPTGNSDNVLLSINPQTNFPYEINIPDDHPAGTFWYHAHRHGSTAVGVTSGGAGALIIKGKRPYKPPTPADPNPIADVDTILHHPDGRPLTEQLFMLQQIAYACFQNDPANPLNDWQQLYTKAGLFNVNSSGPVTYSPWTCPKSTKKAPVSPGVVENFALQLDSASIWDTNGRFTSINGIVQPTMTIAAGELQRWRFVHAGIHDTVNLQIVRAQPVKGKNLIGASALTGNRQKQKEAVAAACVASAETLVPQFEIANDGLTRTRMNTVLTENGGKTLESNYLQPGYRSDILAVFPEEGDYCLLDQAAPPSQQINPATGQGAGGQGPSAPQLLAYIRVKGGTAVKGDLEAYVEQALYDANPQLPTAVRDGLKTGDLTPWAQFTSSPAPRGQQGAFFQITGGATPTSPPLFLINGKSYDPDVVNITRQVSTTDDWLLTAGGEPHIFHIHVNPFEVVDVTQPDANGNQVSIFDANGKCKPSAFTDPQQLANQYCGMKGVFRDTLFVENGYQIRIRTTYERYIGEFVIHCHILDHEDGGMMLNIAIVPDLNAVARGGHGAH
ncbi:MAG TPA: multicopper oxidase domain-containing protein [Allosphingosinicella sp.]